MPTVLRPLCWSQKAEPEAAIPSTRTGQGCRHRRERLTRPAALKFQPRQVAPARVPAATSCANWAPHLQAHGPAFHSEPFLSGPLPGELACLSPTGCRIFSKVDQSQDKRERVSAQGSTVHSDSWASRGSFKLSSSPVRECEEE